MPIIAIPKIYLESVLPVCCLETTNIQFTVSLAINTDSAGGDLEIQILDEDLNYLDGQTNLGIPESWGMGPLPVQYVFTIPPCINKKVIILVFFPDTNPRTYLDIVITGVNIYIPF